MNRFRPIILSVTVVLAGLLSFGLFVRPESASIFEFLNFNKTVCIILTIALMLVFGLLFGFEVLRGRLNPGKALKRTGVVLCLGIAALALGELMAYVCTAAAGVKFKPFGVIEGVGCNVAMSVFLVLLAAVSALIYTSLRNKAVRRTSASMRHNAGVMAAAKYAYKNLYGTVLLMSVLSLVQVFAFGENMVLLVPILCSMVAILLWHATSLKVWLLAAIAAILLYAVPTLHALSAELTIGSFGVVAMLVLLDLMTLLPLADLYITDKKK